MGLVLTTPTAAFFAGPHLLVAPGVLGPIGGALGGVFHLFGGLVLGGLSWTVGVAGKFILNTLGGLIRLLIPASWAKDGLQVMHWVVAVPDYAGTVTTPGGHVTYGFAGINALRDLFMWVGAALLPLTLVYATSRAALGAGHNVAAPVIRVLALAAVLVSYPWWWSQAAAAINQITQFVLALPPVSHGIYKLMQYAVGGVALGGWQLIDLFLMGAIGVALLGLIFLKVVIILLGALLYAIGPLMIALVPTDGGIVIARAWASAALALLMLPLAWSTILAVGALLINDSSTAGPLIAGQGSIASLLGGLLLAFAGLASLWLCIRAAREAGTVLRGQLSGLLVLGRARGGATASTAPASTRRAAESLRSFAGRIAGATGAALGAAGPPGQAVTSGARAFATHSRHGLLGAGGAVIRTGALAAAPSTAALVGRTRAGAAAVRMARAGNASWQTSRSRTESASRSAGPRSSSARSARAPAPERNGQAPTRRRPDADRAGRSSTNSRGRPVYAPPPSAPPAPQTADGRAQDSSRSGRTPPPAGTNKPAARPRPDRANSQPPSPKRASRPAPRRQLPRKGT
ncbi:MAG: hypothetical protein ACTHMY_08675 [Solirubrobacteraceae bacterium]